MIDRYSKWPEMKISQKAHTAKSTIQAINSIFCSQGVPEVVQSDNGQPFRSTKMKMKTFSLQLGYRLQFITPYWPRANCMAERFNPSMKEPLQAGILEGKSLRDSAAEFIQAYRCTPHTATAVSPFEAMHGGRKMKTTLPLLRQTDQIVKRETHRIQANDGKRDRKQESTQARNR